MSTPSPKLDELIAAIQSCDVERVAGLIKEIENIDTKINVSGKDLTTPLLTAADARENLKDVNKKTKNAAIIRLLLDAKANINQYDGYCDPFIVKIRDDDESLCAELLERGADVNFYKAQKSFPPLMSAIDQRKFKLALFLIDRGANVNYQGSNYLRPYESSNALIELVRTCGFSSENIEPQLKVLRALLDAKANPNQTDYKGQNVLCHVADKMNGKKRDQFLTLLLEYNADVLQEDLNGKTPLDYFLKYGSALSIQLILDKIVLTPKNVRELFILFAEFGCVNGLQKIYDSGLDVSLLFFETYESVGALTFSLGYNVFGNNTERFQSFEINMDAVIITAKWFLKYLSSYTISKNLRDRILNLLEHANADLGNLPMFMQNMMRLNSQIHAAILGVMVRELMYRDEVEFCSLPIPTINWKQLFLHPHPKSCLQDVCELFLKKFNGCDEQEIATITRLVDKEINPQKPGLLPYWTLARRDQKWSGFKFCQLNLDLKTKVMEFLEASPICPAMMPGYLSLLKKRLTWAQEQVTEREQERLRTAGGGEQAGVSEKTEYKKPA